MRLGYIIYNERPLSGLVRTQVMSILAAVRREDPSIDITLVAFWQPWVARRFAGDIERMGRELRDNGIRLMNDSRAIIPSRHFLYRPALFPVLHAWARVLFGRALASRFDIVHGRSYFASYVAAELKRRWNHRVVFDMRSLFPLEHVTVGTWRVGDRAYEMWRNIERYTIERSDVTLAVTPPMLDEIHAVSPAARAALVPIAVDTQRLRDDPDARELLRREHAWEDRVVIAYQGSLGLGYLWNNIHNYGRYFQLIKKVEPRAFFLIVTPDTHIGIESVLAQYGLEPSCYAVRTAASAELARWLSAADVGVHLMSHGPDSHTRLGVKIVEYLSCGLPIMVNSNVGAAARLAREEQVGAVVDLDSEDTAATETAIRRLLDQLPPRERCRAVAVRDFSVESCARRLVKIYRTVLGSPAA